MASLFLFNNPTSIAIAIVPVSKDWTVNHYRKFAKSIIPPDTFFRAFPKTGIG